MCKKLIESTVSVIIPVYNTRDYLEKCINSIRNQTYKNLEIIIVDDGSTDGSSEICDKFQQEDKRILVIHKKNEGLFLARKTGIERATGEYIVNVDSDDWIEQEMVTALYEKAVKHNADIVTSGTYREYGNTCDRITDGLEEGVYEEEKKVYVYNNLIFNNHLEQFGITSSLCNKMIRSTIIKALYLNFNEKMCFGEDAAGVFGCCVRSKRIVITHECYYHYVMRFSSIVHSKDSYYFENINGLYLTLKKEFMQSEYKTVLLHQLDLYMVKLVFFGLNYFFGLNKTVSIPYYDFDKSIIDKNAKLVLYGAGRVGQAFYKQICADKLYKLVGWVDKNYMYCQQEQQTEVMPIDAIQRLEYDYIILALKNENMAKAVKQDLISQYNINADKLIWIRPISLVEKYIDI